jgi:hypothetical protein
MPGSTAFMWRAGAARKPRLRREIVAVLVLKVLLLTLIWLLFFRGHPPAPGADEVARSLGLANTH